MFKVPYTHHFGLRSNPFSAIPDHQYLYMSAQHTDALAHLLYGLNTDGGIVLLTGEAGTGKTTVCRCLLSELPEDVDIACIDEPDLTVQALLASACRAFGLQSDGSSSVKRQVDRLNTFLLDNHAAGRRSVLMVDEAQRLSVDVLEQLRLLTNLETRERKLLQVLLIGGRDLREKLARPQLRQLSQRIVARFHLRPLARAEVAPYVHHRLAVAGGRPDMLPASLAYRLHALSGGVPRTINLLCDRALQNASTHGQDQVDAAGLALAAHELGLADAARQWGWMRPSWTVAAIGAVSVLAGAMTLAGHDHRAEDIALAAVASASAPALPAAIGPAVTAMAATPETPPPPAAQVDWPEAGVRHRSAALAWDALLRRWGLEPQPGESACAMQRADQLRCAHGRAGLAALREANLPAVLHLTDDRGRSVDALLAAVDGNVVTLEIAGTERRVAWEALADCWQGRYTLLWRAPPGFGEVLRRGSRGPAVAWLRTRLAQWRDEPDPPQFDRSFDDGLLGKLRQFQLAEGLDPDGVAGVWTLSRLAARTDPSVPLLSAPRKPAR